MKLSRLAVASVFGVPARAAGHVFRTSMTIADFREQMESIASAGIARRDADIDPSKLYPAFNLSVPIDHFHNDSKYEPHTDGVFDLRYWFDASHYRAGGPVIVLQSGETSGEDRLTFLQKGIVAQLAEATGGLGVVLEHRYYGTSFPLANLSIASMRFLTLDQSMADMAYFARHVIFPGLEHLDLTAPKNPYIAYGGSYAGAFVAILRKVYPDVYWGAISSSGVTEAIYDYWQYFEAARIYGPQACVVATQKLTNIIDNIFIHKNGTEYPSRLKAAFGLGNITRNDDFVNAISGGINGLQSLMWDPSENGTGFGNYCNNVSSTALYWSGFEKQRSEVRELISAGGYESEIDALINPMLNYIGYVNATAVAPCARRRRSQDACFTNFNATFYAQDDIRQEWRAWPWQYCTEWGYYSTGSGVPEDQLPLISRLIDIPYSTEVCRSAFNITSPPDLNVINKHGGFAISYPRLAIVDGERDPWRAATPHAIGQPDRANTASEPFWLIADGVHHWDEYGVFPNQTTASFPPPAVVETQQSELMWVQEWLQEWQDKYSDCGDL